VEVDSPPGSRSEVIEDLLEASRRLRTCVAEDEGVVGILKNRARDLRGEGVQEETISPVLMDEALENVHNNDEKVRGEGIPLPKPISAEDPVPRNAS
jgi:hypothetical protein